MAKYEYGKVPVRRKKKRTGLKIALVLLLLLAVVVAAVGVLFSRYYGLSNYISDSDLLKELGVEEEGAVDDSDLNLPDNKDVYNLLLVGVDRRDASWSGNSDSMILMSVNKKQKKVHMISFMRDLYADIEGYGVRKLNAACAIGGCPLLVRTIESNYRVNIDNYAAVDFNSMIQIVDMIGGVTLDVSDAEIEVANGYITDMAASMGVDPGPHLFTSSGTVECDGFQAVGYSRVRYVGNSDYERTERQRTVMTRIFDKVRSMNLIEMNNFITAVLPLVSHNIDSGTMLTLVPQLPSMMAWPMEQDRLPYDGLYTVDSEILYPDMEQTVARLQQTIYG